MQPAHPTMDLLRTEMGVVLSSTMTRLIVAALLGGIIGLERELRHKPAGLRTNMFICFGAAMFTLLSDQLAAAYGGDHTRVAAQIIPGIGFIGAGAILHDRGSITGLTTAATIFVTASVGMAVGGGFYITSAFATGVVLVALAVLGRLERRFSLKSERMTYEVTGASTEALITELNRILDSEKVAMFNLHVARLDGSSRVQFCVDGSREEHERLPIILRRSSLLHTVNSLGCVEHE
jgi:putative Mg2+ transporter-C (MgtC) family protein